MRSLPALTLLFVLATLAPATARPENRIPAAQAAGRYEALPGGIFRTAINGIPIYLKPGATAEVVEVQMWVHAGSKNEPAPIRGISHYLEHLFYRGTTKRAALENRLEIIDVGGVTTAGTWYDWTYYRNKVRSADVEKAIDTLTDSLTDLTLAWESVEAERSVVGSEIRLREDDPGIFAWEKSLELLYAGHPYGERIIGDFETTGRITQEDFRDYYERAYHPENIAFVITGAYDPAQVMDLLEARIGNFSRPDASPGAPPVPATASGLVVEIATKAMSEPNVTLSFRLPGFKHPDRVACEVLDHALSGREDSILDQLRLEGIASRISGGYTVLEDAGAWVVTGYPAGETTIPELVTAMVAKIAAMREGVEAEFLAASQTALIEADRQSKATTDGEAYAIGRALTEGRLENYWSYEEEVAAVSAERIDELLDYYFTLNNASVLLIGTDEQQAALGAEPLAALTASCSALPEGPSDLRLALATMEVIHTEWTDLPAATAATPEIRVIRHHTGDQLILRHVPGAIQTAIVWSFSHGSAHETVPGETDLMLQLLEFGGPDFTREELLAQLASMGGSLNLVVERLESRIELVVPAANTEEGYAFLLNLINEGDFTADAIATASATQGSERKSLRDDIRQTASQLMWERGFAGGSVTHNPKGIQLDPSMEGDSGAITSEEYLTQYEHFFRQLRSVVVSGAVPRTMLDTPDEADWPTVAWPDPIVAGAVTPGPYHHVIDRTQAAVYLGARSAGIGSYGEDYAAAQVLARGLGLRNFRDLIYAQALAYSSSAQLLDAGDEGVIALYAYVAPENVERAQTELRLKVEDVLAHGFPAQELTNIKGWWLGSLAISMEDQGAVARRLASYEARGLGWDYQEEFEANISAVTNEDVMRVAAAVFGERSLWVEVVVGPE